MKETLLKKVNTWASENHVLNPKTVVVAGISGGADSICLLHVLDALGRERRYSVAAVHVNHMLRGEEAKQDEQFVQKICEEWAIPLKVFHMDIKAFSIKNGYSEEEAGRILRYRCFDETRKEMDAQYIAVAHHREDQAETIFLNLLRGSGLDGLCGMEDVQRHILRPFLDISKKEIEDYLQENNLKYRTDSSNLRNDYRRNVIRNILFPKIRSMTGSPITSTLYRTSQLLKEDRKYLDEVSAQKYQWAVMSQGKKSVVLDRKKVIELPQAISGRIIRIAWEAVTGSIKGLEAKHVAAALALAKKEGTHRSLDFPKGVRFQTEYDKTIVTAEEEKKPKTFMEKVRVPSVVFVKEMRVHAEIRLYTRKEYKKRQGRLGIEKQNEKSLMQVFDYDSIIEGIYIRNRLPGDVFSPYRGPGKKKLKDFLMDQKIPVKKRNEVLLLADGENIMWVIGLRTSKDYQITQNTVRILYVKITESVE